MEIQSQIKRTLSAPENIELVSALLKTDYAGPRPRTDLANEVCQRLGFIDALGKTQSSTCLKALRDLEAAGHFVLPEGGKHQEKKDKKKHTPRGLPEAVPEPQDVPATAGKVQNLHLVLAESELQIRTWNELMLREHPQGAGPLVGRQLRYLLGSDHGWLGGLGFGASALHLDDRDRWIGWDWETRRGQLHRVVGLSRFLIRPQVHCRNLASRVLALCMKRFPQDFEARYGFQPWLVETFVDREHFAGTCFRAANWQWIGRTKGRGRQDRDMAMGQSVKEIYVHPLEPSFRVMIGLPPNSGRSALALDDGVDTDHWTEAEFGGAPLGDKRRSQRLVGSAATLAGHPGRAFCGATQGDVPAVKGYYRFIDQPDDSAVTMDNILLPHRDRTIRRMKDQKTVLCIQDGTDLDYSGLDQCEGLGVIGTNQTGAKSRGLHLHSTLATTPEGVPLGVLLAQCTAPEPKSEEEKERSSKVIPIEEKKTFSWIVGLRDCMDIAREMPHTRLVSVMDREADFYELFDEQRRNPTVDLLVRAKYNRVTTADTKLFDGVLQTPVRSRLRIHVPRQSARPKKSKQKARAKRAERTANVSMRYQCIELKPPEYLRDREPLALWIIAVTEEKPPKGAEPLRWFLLTTMEITSADDAEKCLRWYCLRWRIEDWHRVLKSGCQIEEIAHRTVDRLRRAIAIHLVIAWRIMLMTLLGREQPELPAEVLFTDLEIEVLNAVAKKKRRKPPTQLDGAVRLVAQLGGYLGRKNDPPPGHQLMWQGYATLQLMREGYALGVGHGSPE
jgi:hypothetical protein